MKPRNPVQPMDPNRDTSDTLTRRDVADRDGQAPPEPYWVWARIDNGENEEGA